MSFHHMERRTALMRRRNISLVLDVGANGGQFVGSLRSVNGYAGRVVSFEPMREAFARLENAAAGDRLWETRNCALGESNGSARINISVNSVSSSLLPVSNRSLEIEPRISFMGSEEISIRRLDDLLGEIARPDDVIYLKIDTQGYDLRVLQGALGVIRRFELIQVEVSFFPVYQDEPLACDVMKFLDELDYRVVGIEPGWTDPKTLEMLQADLIFARKFVN